MTHYQADFDPKRDGFAFVNRFELPLAPRWGRLAYGLCGGMCFAALDYWRAGRAVPGDLDAPNRGPLWRWLWRRQIASFELPAGPLRLLAWMLRSDARALARTSQRELPKLTRLLEQGQPAVLLLVRAKGLANPTLNHQVLAVAWMQEGDVTTFSLYDPNYPGETTTLRLTPDGAWHSTGERARGFYVLRYAPRAHGLPES